MNGENPLDPRNLTFSQAYGYEDLPQPLKLGELSREARTKLWSLLYLSVTHESGTKFGEYTRQLHNLPVRTSVRPAEHEVLEP